MRQRWSYSRAGMMSHWLEQTKTNGKQRHMKTIGQMVGFSIKEMEDIVDTLNQGEEHLAQKENAEREGKKGQGGQMGDDAGEVSGSDGNEGKKVSVKRRTKRISTTGS